MTFEFDQPAVLVNRGDGGRDGDGNRIRTEAPRLVFGVFDPVGAPAEQTDQQQRETAQPTFFLPHGTVIGAVDALIWPAVLDEAGRPVIVDGRVQGDRYEVDGTPIDWQHPNGWTPGVAVKLKRITG